ncbi:MAG: N-acetylmuramidase [Chitinophagaceae bacterium]|nr:N-acetylmuramidase [Chitinophagaceae bacterium]
MANFLLAYKKTAKMEGGYANDPVDRGGETWRGVARKMWPKWKGWDIVDDHKKRSGFPRHLSTDSELQKHVLSFYKTNFWDAMRGDELLNQGVAESIYDSGVNMGVSQAIKLAQRVLGIPATGRMDKTTLNKLNNK